MLPILQDFLTPHVATALHKYCRSSWSGLSPGPGRSQEYVLMELFASSTAISIRIERSVTVKLLYIIYTWCFLGSPSDRRHIICRRELLIVVNGVGDLSPVTLHLGSVETPIGMLACEDHYDKLSPVSSNLQRMQNLA